MHLAHCICKLAWKDLVPSATKRNIREKERRDLMPASINTSHSLPLLVLCGKSGSGKTTTAMILQRKLGLKRVVTYTTRQKRKGEKDGIDYHFVSEEKFRQMIEASDFLEYAIYNASFGKVYYGSLKKDYDTVNSVIVLNPKGVEKLLVFSSNSLIVDLVPSRETLKQRLISRGDDPKEIERRLSADDTDFIHMYHQAGSERIIQIPIQETDTPEDVSEKVIETIQSMIQKK